jgi:hypothetical protein
MSLAALLRKPILLVDVSDEGRRLPSLVGLTSEMYCSTDERSRFFSISGRWYVSTREGIPLGPYRSIVEAEGGLCDFIHAPSSEKAALEKACPPYVTLPTSVQNLFFFPAGPARQAVVRGIYLGAEAEHVAGLIDELHSLFAYIIFYAGAVSSNPLMLPVLSRVSEVIHAVIENDTKVADIQAAQKILQNHRADPVPFVLIRPRRSGRFEPSS